MKGCLRAATTWTWILGVAMIGSHAAAGDDVETSAVLEVRRTITVKRRGGRPVVHSPTRAEIAYGIGKRVVVRDLKTKKRTHIRLGRLGGANVLCYSPSGQKLAIGTGYGRIVLWDRRTQETSVSAKAEERSDTIVSLAFAPDGRTLASGGNSKLLIWNVKTLKPSKALKGHRSFVAGVAFSPDGRLLASGGYDRKVIVWNLAKGTSEVVHRDFVFVNSVFFSADRRVVVVNSKSVVRKIDLDTKKKTVLLQGRGQNYSAALSPHRTLLALGNGWGEVCVFDLRSRRVLALRVLHMNFRNEDGTIGYLDRVLNVAFGRDEANLVSVGDDRRIQLVRIKRKAGN